MPLFEFVDQHALSQALVAISGGFVAIGVLGLLGDLPQLAHGSKASRLACVVGAVTSGVLAGDAPTGTQAIDVVYVVVFAALIGLLVSDAPKSSLLIAAGPPLVFLFLGGSWSLIEAICSFGPLGALITLNSLSRSANVAHLMSAVFLGVSPFWYPTNVRSGAPSVVATAVLGVLSVSYLIRRRAKHKSERDRATKSGPRRLATGGVVVLIMIGAVTAGWIAVKQLRDTKNQLERSVAVLTDTLGPVESLNLGTAKESLTAAATELHSAKQRIDSPLWTIAKFVPIGAQNANSTRDVIVSASSMVDSAKAIFDGDPIKKLRRPDGSLDISPLTGIGESLKVLNNSIPPLKTAVSSVDGPWIVMPLRRKVTTFAPYVDRAAKQIETATTATEFLPELLGADHPRTYLLVFPTTSEARGSGGLIGNWGELTIDSGRISLTQFDRVQALVEGGKPWADRVDTFPASYLKTYQAFKPRQYYQNLLASPDFPTNASIMASQYPEVTDGRTVDGVISVDPVGLAAILDLEGPLTIPSLPEPVTSASAPKTLLFDLYVAANDAQDGRIKVLEEIARGTFGRLRDIPLDEPRRIVTTLGPAFAGRHIQMWSKNQASQGYLASIGAAGSYQKRQIPVGRDTVKFDSFGVVSQNASGNKIDWFANRSISYNFTVAPEGRVTATATIDVENRAPADGLPDYIIGNLITDRKVAKGTSTQLFWVYSRLDLESATIGAEQVELKRGKDLGLNVYSVVLDIAAMSHQTITLNLRGQLPNKANRLDLELLYQPTVNADVLTVTQSDGLEAKDQRRLSLLSSTILSFSP